MSFVYYDSLQANDNNLLPQTDAIVVDLTQEVICVLTVKGITSDLDCYDIMGGLYLAHLVLDQVLIQPIVGQALTSHKLASNTKTYSSVPNTNPWLTKYLERFENLEQDLQSVGSVDSYFLSATSESLDPKPIIINDCYN